MYGELLAEFLGTFVLIAFGDGVVGDGVVGDGVVGDGVVGMAVAALPGSGRTAGPTVIFQAAGDWLLIAWGWAMAVAFAVWVADGVSGARLNPAVTLAFAVRRKFSWPKVLPYMATQVIDAFDLAAKAPKSGGQALATCSIFATFPAAFFHGAVAGRLIDQIVGTAGGLTCSLTWVPQTSAPAPDRA